MVISIRLKVNKTHIYIYIYIYINYLFNILECIYKDIITIIEH